MAARAEHAGLRRLLCQSISDVCRAKLPDNSSFIIEGLLAITIVQRNQVFLVSVDENVNQPATQTQDKNFHIKQCLQTVAPQLVGTKRNKLCKSTKNGKKHRNCDDLKFVDTRVAPSQQNHLRVMSSVDGSDHGNTSGTVHPEYHDIRNNCVERSDDSNAPRNLWRSERTDTDPVLPECKHIKLEPAEDSNPIENPLDVFPIKTEAMDNDETCHMGAMDSCEKMEPNKPVTNLIVKSEDLSVHESCDSSGPNLLPIHLPNLTAESSSVPVHLVSDCGTLPHHISPMSMEAQSHSPNLTLENNCLPIQLPYVPHIYGKSKSISYLQMPCRHSSPGHQQTPSRRKRFHMKADVKQSDMSLDPLWLKGSDEDFTRCPTCAANYPSTWSGHECGSLLLAGEARYQCPVCCMMFGTRQNMQQHLAGKHGAPRYHCQFCPTKFRWRAELKRHLQKIHANSASKRDDVLKLI